MLAQAIALAAQIHKEQYDKGGEPYILHCLRVMQTVRTRGFDESTQCAAVLHDVIEDFDRKVFDLKEIYELISDSTNYDVVGIVNVLTKQPGDDYLGRYIPNIKQYFRCKAIKLADLEDNLQPLRQPTLRDKDLLRLQKYHMAYRMLRGE